MTIKSIKWRIPLVFLFLGIMPPLPAENSVEDLINPLSVQEVQAMEKRLPLLKNGMSMSEVVYTLKLPLEKVGFDGSGPSDSYWSSAQLRRDAHLTLFFDHSKKHEGEFIEYRTHGPAWKQPTGLSGKRPEK